MQVRQLERLSDQVAVLAERVNARYRQTEFPTVVALGAPYVS